MSKFIFIPIFAFMALFAFAFGFRGAASEVDPTLIGSDIYIPVDHLGSETGEPCLDPMAQRDWDNDCVCKRQKIKIDWVKHQGQKLNDFAWDEIRSKQLVVIGDEHGVTDPDALLNLLALSRSSQGKECVLFEYSSDRTESEFLQLLKTTTGLPTTDHLRRYYGKIARGALELGFKLYMVDDPRNWFGDETPTDYQREMHMAAVTLKLFGDRNCDRAVFVVGKQHIAKEYYLQDNMIETLRKSKLSVVRLNPILAPAGGTEAPSEWNGVCLKETFTPSEPLIFKNSGIDQDFLLPGIGFPATVMKYGSFDFSILFPNAQFEKTYLTGH